MVEARAERLTDAQRDVVRAGAVLGDFDTGLLTAVAQQAVAAVGEAMTAATDAGLLETVGGKVDFRHALIREAVIDAMLRHDVQALHGRAGAALEGLPVRNAATLERRAYHLEQIEQQDEAAELFTSAAETRSLVCSQRKDAGPMLLRSTSPPTVSMVSSGPVAIAWPRARWTRRNPRSRAS
jgi:predicted ATPase